MKRNLLAERSAAITTDQEALLRAAMEKLGGYILWYLEDCCGDYQEAENLFQQLWVSVYKTFPPEKYDHLPMVRHRAYQLYVDHVRARNTRSFVGYTDELPEPDPVSFFPEPANQREEDALKQRFWELFPGLELEERHKQAFWLFHRYGYTVAEVAEKLASAPSTVHDWIKQVREHCGEYLAMEDNHE
ncbi:RNA polymerase sigma factor [Cerasicoccus fimbriatus]|uniref:RNA polymerase sigma factor n=1 Tax=Cerasicoccus fimbriatus TaxID=3014554 RepID=UPI0022B2D0F3|nr:sigma-70 family RNA polymerase sigma factor [Cerasicoccus sp. TK19100]